MVAVHVGRALAEVRRRQGWAQAEVAAWCGISQPRVAAIERCRAPRPATVERWARATGMPVWAIYALACADLPDDLRASASRATA